MQGISLSDFMLMTNGAASTDQVILGMLLASILAIYLYYFYKFNYIGVLYSHSFNVSLVIITMVVCTIMMIIGSNLALSLGMVGALSIIRYRSAIKEPLDTGYLFWAVVNGLGIGAGSYKVIIFGNLFLSVLIFIFLKTKKTTDTYLLTATGTNFSFSEVSSTIKKHATKSSLKLQSIHNNNKEYIFEIKIKEGNLDALSEELYTHKNFNLHITSFDNESPV